jgi:DNA-directed RNA polymerase sigma subunit (sigma70/sigma32)
MNISSVSANSSYVPTPKTSKALSAEYSKEIKTLKNFKDLLSKEAKVVKNSKMDDEFKQETLDEVGTQMQLINEKIKEMTDDKKSLTDNKSMKNDAVDETVTIGYGISYLA